MKKISSFYLLATVLVILMLLLIGVPDAGFAAEQETVIFEDSFQRPNSSSPGGKWQEYLVRRTVSNKAGSVPVKGDTPWQIKGGTLYFDATGQNNYIEDFVQTTEKIPMDNTRVEFEIRATGGTRLGYIGPTAVWAGEAANRRDAMNVTGQPVLVGIEAWYRWENQGTRGMLLLGIDGAIDHAQMLFSGLNQGRFARHVITIRDGKMTYESPDAGTVTYNLKYPPEPGAARYFSFGARLYDKGVRQTIEIRNFKVTYLGLVDVSLGKAAEEKINQELGPLARELDNRVNSLMIPLTQDIRNMVRPVFSSLEPRISALLEPLAGQIESTIQTQVQASMGAARMMESQVPGAMPGMPEGMAEAMQAQVMEQVRAQVDEVIAGQAQSMMTSMKPQIEQMVKSQTDPIVAQAQKLAQERAQGMVSELNSFIDSRMGDIMTGVKPLLPPETQKLPEATVKKELRKKIEDSIKPQIMALIEESIQSAIRNNILVPIEDQILELANEVMSTTVSRITTSFSTVASSFSYGPMVLSIGQEQVESLKANILSQVQEVARKVSGNPIFISVLVNGKQVSYDVIPIIKDGRTLVPIRGIAESLGADVNYDPKDQSITLNQGDTEIKLKVNSKEASAQGKAVYLDVPATVVNGRTMVPARFIGESLGASVGWDSVTQTANISK